MTELFFELLQISLRTREKLSRVLSAREWEALYEEAERQAVVGLLLTGLERLPEEQLPPLEIKLQWIGEVQMDEATSKMHQKRAKELTKIFRAVGFRTCILKGVGTALLYPNPLRRQCGDIDLWASPVKSENVKCWAFRKTLMAWLRSQYEVEHAEWHHVGARIFEDVDVEVHVHPAWMYWLGRNRILQRFFDHESQEWHESEFGFYVPRVEFDAVFSLVHTFHHFLEEGVGLRHVVDYFYILRALPEKSRREAMQTLKSIGLGKFSSAMMWVLRDVCGMSASDLLCEPNEKEGEFLLGEIMTGGNFGQTRQDGKKRNSFSRWMMMVKHYPCEVLWMVPWKVWHRCWRFMHK